MFKDNYSVKTNLKRLFMQRYERYLPTAFDESMTILEKMNKIIQSHNAIIDVVNTHVEFTSDQLERAFGIIDENIGKQLKQFRDELEEQKTLYEELRDQMYGDLLPDTVKQKLEEWLLNGTIEDLILDTVFPDWVERLQIVENGIAELRNHGLNIETFGAVSLDIDPTFDSSIAINEAFEYAEQYGISDILIPNKTYGVSNPIELKSGIKLKTQSGALKVLEDSQWSTRHTGRGVLEYVNIENTTTENLKIVGNNSNENNAYNGILLMNTHSNYFKGVHLKDLGGVTTVPSSGLIRGVSRDVTTDISGAEKYNDVVGSVKDNTFIKCTIELTSGTQSSFAVRMLSNWEKNTPLEDVVNRTENNNFIECNIIGEYFWNHFELAGTGTVNNSVKDCYFTGNSATAIDIDKGSSFNTVDNNFIENVGLPSAHLENSNLHLAVIHVHGTSSGVRSNGNTITNNKILNSDNPETRSQSTNAGVLSVAQASDNIFENNFIDGLNNSVTGAGIHISHDSVNNTFSKNIVRNVRNGVTTNLNSSTHERNKIINNDFYNVRTGVSYGGVSGSNIEDIIINDNRMFLSDKTGYGILVTDACHSVILRNNIVYNGFEGISTGSPFAVVDGNKVINADTRSFRINSVGRPIVTNNTSVTPGSDDIIIVRDLPLMYGNIFNTKDLNGGITTFNNGAPSDGEWNRGDTVYASVPRPGNYIGWVCTETGSPGTWKGFGLIEEN